MTVNLSPLRECVLDNLRYVIRTSIGTRMFSQSLWETDQGVRDITDGAKKFCALYVSSLLVLFRFEGRPLCEVRHATVKGLVADLERCGWVPSHNPDEVRHGGVILWEEKRDNEHVGFYVDGRLAVSTCRIVGTPVVHGWKSETDGLAPRAIIKVFNHPVLFDHSTVTVVE